MQAAGSVDLSGKGHARSLYIQGVMLMGKLVLQMQVSVDGYVGRSSRGPEWQVWDWGENCTWDDRLIGQFNAFFEQIDCILLSRKIVEGGYIDHWTKFASKFPDKAEFAFAKRIVEARKVIFSRTLKEAKWSRAELGRRPIIGEVDDLKAQTERIIVAFGGAGFASSLIAADLVDEFQFYVNPVALHQGLSIFAQKGIDSDLELLGAETFDSGIVLCRYAPRGRSDR
jgi:dihydrofolate reductase